MKRIMVSGCLGQIGTELVTRLRRDYGAANVLATDVREDAAHALPEGPFEILDVREAERYAECVSKFKPDTIYHLAGILSACGGAWMKHCNAAIPSAFLSQISNPQIGCLRRSRSYTS